MLFQQLGKLRNWLELKPELLKRSIILPSATRRSARPRAFSITPPSAGCSSNRAWCSLSASASTWPTLPKNSNTNYTAFHNTVLFAEALEKIGVMGKVRIGARFRSHLSKQETSSLARDYYYALISLIGMSNRLRLLTVCYATPEEDTFRMISARKPTKREEAAYA